MDKRFLATLAIIVAVLAGVFVLTTHKKAEAPASSSASASATKHIEGEGKSGVTLTEYGDYECPACYEYYPILKQVFDKYSSQIYFQFRNFPLVQIHKNAYAGARAAEAADLQGKFWQMHDALYDNQDPNGAQGWVASDNPLTYFTAFAKQIGLNTTKFTSDYKSSLVNDRINADLAVAQKLNFSGTPAFTINGQPISAPQPTVDAFSKVIDAAIAKQSKQ
jgi:protein-disulfide isomerase